MEWREFHFLVLQIQVSKQNTFKILPAWFKWASEEFLVCIGHYYAKIKYKEWANKNWSKKNKVNKFNSRLLGPSCQISIEYIVNSF